MANEYVRPLPCVRDEGGETIGRKNKELFAKIFEELYELQEAVVRYEESDDDEELIYIAEEAADVKTAVTTLEYALCINEAARDEAQRRVNAKNRSRGRL